MHSNGAHNGTAGTATGEYAVRLRDVSKRYLLDPAKPWKLKDALAHPGSMLSQMRAKEPFWALRNISLDVRHGEVVGVIGVNGSGKSSLLRILAGISPPTTGSVEIDGRFGALLDLGAGFHPNATGRQNAYVNALFMGLAKADVNEKMQSIIDFSGLGAFIDQPMRTYSSGMYLRLGFSVAIHVQPDILMIDEVLAVGDADFQEKCFAHFHELKARGTTVIVVTHNIDTVIEFADRVLMLEKGEIKLDGDPDTVVKEYVNHLRRQSPAVNRAFERANAMRLTREDLVLDEDTELVANAGDRGTP